MDHGSNSDALAFYLGLGMAMKLSELARTRGDSGAKETEDLQNTARAAEMVLLLRARFERCSYHFIFLVQGSLGLARYFCFAAVFRFSAHSERPTNDN